MEITNRMNSYTAGLAAVVLLLFIVLMHAQPAEAVRLKDISSFSGCA